MKAMIFAAGLGTRLQPYTSYMPKALVPVAGVPMLERIVKRLMAFDVHEMIINIHHFPDQIIDFLQEKNNFGIHIEISDERDLLLDTGGGLKKASGFFDDGKPFLLHNVDVLSTISLDEMMALHLSGNALATLAVSKRTSSRYFLFDENMRLCGWEHTGKGEVRLARESGIKPLRFAFSGIHIISPDIFGLMTETGRFSLVDVYLRLSYEQKIIGYEHDPLSWIDLGRPEDLARSEELIKSGKFTGKQ